MAEGRRLRNSNILETLDASRVPPKKDNEAVASQIGGKAGQCLRNQMDKRYIGKREKLM